ncbi:MAG: hypothetical protein H7Z74_15355, partial [Anaerolineae bacterium]|nr:hypothetical protein [Gemmatimonadaceae bacterium]
MTTLLIPGTQATCLVDQNDVVVFNAVRVSVGLQKNDLGGRPPSEWARLLSMEHEPGELEPVRTSLEPGTELRPGKVVVTPYQLFPRAYEMWSYDWRWDLRWNANLLLETLRSRCAGGEERFNLIGHSQGGLLIILASKIADKGEFARFVKRVVLVGVPLAGTLRAVEALTFGHESLGDSHRPSALRMARTWPAIYQMLPAWPCVVDERNVVLPDDEQLFHLSGWSSATTPGTVDEGFLVRMLETQEMLVHPLDNFGPGIAVRTVMAVNQTTGLALVKAAAAAGSSFLRIATKKKSGDSLVHYEETLRWGDKPFSYTITPYGGGVEPHATLCADETISEHIKAFLSLPVPDANDVIT